MKTRGGWIPIDKDMIDDPRLLEAATHLMENYVIAHATKMGGQDMDPVTALHFTSNALLGALVTLWKFADEHIRDDDTLPMTSVTLDAFLGIENFFDLIPREWVDILDDGTVILPGYCEKNRLIAKRKAAVKRNARQATFRARHKVNGNGVSNVHVTEHTPVTEMVDQDQDQDQDLKKKKSIQKKKDDAVRERKAARRQAGRLPIDWQATDAELAYARDMGLAEFKTAEAFKDHWLASNLPTAIKRDWSAAFRTWCRRACEERRIAPQGLAPGRRDEAGWAEARTSAKASGFREPWPQESLGAYVTAVKLAQTRPPSRGLPPLNFGSVLKRVPT